MLLGMFARRIIASAVSAELDPATAELQTLSLFNRRATANANGIGGAKTIYGRKSGKLYFEAIVNAKVSSANNRAVLGIARTDATYQMSGNYAYACGVFIGGATGRVWSNGETLVDLTAPVNGTRYGFAFDLDSGLFWVRRDAGDWNGSAMANPATGAGGFSMSDLSGYDVTPTLTSDLGGQQVTFNFSAADFVAPAPSGFSPWPTDTTGDNEGLGRTALNSLRRQNMTISGGGLVATRTATPAIARSPDYKSEGKFYVEFTATNLNSNGDACGFAQFNATAANMVSDGSTAAMVYRSGNIWTDTASKGTIGAIGNGDRVDVAIDMDIKVIWFRRNGGQWNGSATADPASGTGGIPYNYDVISPAVSLGGSGGGDGSSWTANFGASAFAGAVPVGFTAGWDRRRAPMVQYLWTGAIS